MSYHPTASRVGAAGYALFALWWLGGLVLDGDPAAVARVAPWLVGTGIAVYAVFWRPAVLVDDHGVTLRNVLRDVRVPWPGLRAVDTRLALTLVTDDARHQSWAAAAPGRPSVLSGTRFAPSRPEDVPDPRWTAGAGATPAASRELTSDSGAAAFLVEHRWALWRDGRGTGLGGAEDSTSVTWNALVVTGFVGCLVLGVLSSTAL